MPRVVVVLLLGCQTALLAYSAACHSPVMDEPAHLAAGVSHWRTGHFELYKVNPPLVKTVAGWPAQHLGAVTDWSRHVSLPGARSEFEVGRHFVRLNGPRSLVLLKCARWALIPLVLLGGLVCYAWAAELFGAWAGCLALTCWVHSPNVLAYGSLITPDAAAASLGALAGYAFSRWLGDQRWSLALIAGLTLGFAELSKMTWTVLFALWPLLWFLRQRRVERSGADARSTSSGTWGTTMECGATNVGWTRSFAQLLLILGLGLLVLNAGYGFQGTGRPLGDYAFVSRTLAGQPVAAGASTAIGDPRCAGNRFRGAWLEQLRLPLPAAWLEGLDLQKRDFELGMWSFLNGEHRHGGWWYYYLEALALKVPLGLWLLSGLAVAVRMRQRANLSRRKTDASGNPTTAMLSDLCLLGPALAVLILVSSQTGFSRYVRYVLPAFPFVFVWTSQVVSDDVLSMTTWRWRNLVGLATLWFTLSSLAQAPHWLSYFNELAGGPRRGHEYLIDANIDWGQDLLFLQEWMEQHPGARPLYVAHHGPVDPRDLGLSCQPLPPRKAAGKADVTRAWAPGWYAISAHHLHSRGQTFDDFRSRLPDDLVGHSLYIYHVAPASAAERSPSSASGKETR